MVLFGLDSSIFALEFGDSASFGSASANSTVCFLIMFSAVSFPCACKTTSSSRL